ncbi:MAG: phenylalanine--tRNA ligase subunit alpha [Bacillota bacterium]
MQDKLKALEEQALKEISGAASMQNLENIRLKFLGKKGEITQILRGMGALPEAERPAAGNFANRVRDNIGEALDKRAKNLAESELTKRLEEERLDITLPGQPFRRGHFHPLRIVLEEIERIFLGLGFTIAEGPEIESDYYNFEALNIPKNHPAREMHDSLYISPDVLLRTHTSPVQVRTMEQLHPRPVRIIAPGRVYRRDALDATHSPVFHQVEGLLVDEQVSFGDLKGVLTIFVQAMFGADRRIRFRPSFFPFTEPSAEVDVSCIRCNGKGCRVCSHTGWLEILGAGSVHPNVLAMSKYDPRKYSGFAFGMGLERIAILKYDIEDIRLFYENDIRFLHQF